MAYTVLPGYAGIYCCYSMQLLHSIANPYTARYYKHVTLRTGTPEALEGKLRALRHFRAIKMSYVDSLLIWRMLDEFQVESQNGPVGKPRSENRLLNALTEMARGDARHSEMPS